MICRLLLLAVALAAPGCDPLPGDSVRPSPPVRGGAAVARRDALPPGARVPVVVELFSSEGCSSCPPADEVLRDLDEHQPIAGVEVIPLELHVDYWNDIGWADPFSSPAWSSRQRDYSNAARRPGIFTPEAVVDGGTSLVGSRSGDLASAVREAALRPHVPVTLAIDGESLHVDVGELGDAKASLWVGVTETGLSTSVPSGENAGRTLAHAPVVRSLDRAGAATAGTRVVSLPAHATHGPARVVVLLQSDDDRSILGAASLAI